MYATLRWFDALESFRTNVFHSVALLWQVCPFDCFSLRCFKRIDLVCKDSSHANLPTLPLHGSSHTNTLGFSTLLNKVKVVGPPNRLFDKAAKIEASPNCFPSATFRGFVARQYGWELAKLFGVCLEACCNATWTLESGDKRTTSLKIQWKEAETLWFLLWGRSRWYSDTAWTD